MMRAEDNTYVRIWSGLILFAQDCKSVISCRANNVHKSLTCAGVDLYKYQLDLTSETVHVSTDV